MSKPSTVFGKSIFGSSTYVPQGITLYPKQTAWSFSAVQQHTKCPQQFRFVRVERRPVPPQPALERGKDAHAAVAEYIAAGAWPQGAMVPATWEPYLDSLRPFTPATEVQVAWDKLWRPCEWYAPGVWGRAIVDCFHLEPDSHKRKSVVIHEWKTGKPWSDHPLQMRLYGLVGFLMAPDAHEVRVVMGYLDQGPAKRPVAVFQRSSVETIKQDFVKFSEDFLNDDIYPARPNRFCGSCHFRKSNGGPCEHA